MGNKSSLKIKESSRKYTYRISRVATLKGQSVLSYISNYSENHACLKVDILSLILVVFTIPNDRCKCTQ